MFSLILAAAVAAQPVPPAKTADVNIGSVKLRIPLPDGYCLPVGDQIAAAQMLAAIDTDNVTLLSLNDCDPKRADDNYLLVKAPLAALNAQVSRSELMAELAAPETAQEIERGASTDQDTNQRIAELGAKDASIETDIKMRGNDDVCIYMGGLGTERVADKAVTKAAAGCITAIGGRMISFYSYRTGSDPEGYRKLLPELKAWASKIQPVN